MKLEPGQVWRRPDGTLWRCAEIAPSGYATMVWNGQAGQSFAIRDAIDNIVLHKHAVEEGWTREVSAEAKRAYADLVGMNGLTADAHIMGVNEEGQVVTNSPLMAAAYDAAIGELPDEGT